MFLIIHNTQINRLFVKMLPMNEVIVPFCLFCLTKKLVSQICIMRHRKRIRKERVSGKTDDLGKNGSYIKTFFRVDCFTTMEKRYFARTYNVHNENDAY